MGHANHQTFTRSTKFAAARIRRSSMTCKAILSSGGRTAFESGDPLPHISPDVWYGLLWGEGADLIIRPHDIVCRQQIEPP
jgi:hypothetical protein